MAAGETHPVFGTVLIARTSVESPPPHELQLRHQCSKLRIVDRLAGGAHLLLPESDTTIAVRIYYPQDLEGDQPEGDRGLVAFREAFKYPVVIFVLPDPVLQKALSDFNSFVNRAQTIMNHWDGSTSQQKPGFAQVLITLDVASALEALSSVVSSLDPQHRKLEKAYVESMNSKSFAVSQDHEPDPSVARLHLQNAFRDWAGRFDLAPGDADILMTRLKSISNIATADRATLDRIPIDEQSKDAVQAFFGSNIGERTARHEQRRPMTNVLQGSNGQTCVGAFVPQVPERQFRGARLEGGPEAYMAQPPPQWIASGTRHAGQDQQQMSSHFQPGLFNESSFQSGTFNESHQGALRSDQYRGQYYQQAPQPTFPNFAPMGPFHGGPMSRIPADQTSQRLLSRFDCTASRNGCNPLSHRIGNRIRPPSTY